MKIVPQFDGSIGESGFILCLFIPIPNNGFEGFERKKNYLNTAKVFRQRSDIYIDMVAASHSNSSYRATKEGGFFLCGKNESDAHLPFFRRPDE